MDEIWFGWLLLAVSFGPLIATILIMIPSV
jgi:hypothetical protein